MASESLTGRQAVIVDGITDWGDDYAVERRLWDPLGIHLTVAHCSTEDEIIAAALDADAVIVIGLYTPITAAVVKALCRCRLIIRYGIGVDNIDVSAATAQGIVVANAAEYCVTEVADHAASLILALARRVVFLDRSVRAGNWSAGAALTGPVSRLSKLTLGLVGFGRIARQVARKMAPFVGITIAYDPYLDQELAAGYGVQLVTLEELMARADFISVHVPLTPSTRHLIGRAELARMKSTAFLINTSRGPVIDESELIKALQKGRIAGAALDVVEAEPLAANSPLRGLDNVILTPHFAASSIEAVQDLRISVARAVADVLQGYWPAHVVNPAVEPRLPLRNLRQKTVQATPQESPVQTRARR